MTTSKGDALTNRDGDTEVSSLLQPPIVIVISLDSYFHLLGETEARHGCVTCSWLPGEQSKDQTPAFVTPGHFLSRHRFSEKGACRVEGTAEGQKGLFASQDARKLPRVALAAS